MLVTLLSNLGKWSVCRWVPFHSNSFRNTFLKFEIKPVARIANYWESGFFLTRIFLYKDRNEDSVYIREYRGQKKPASWHILCSSVYLIKKFAHWFPAIISVVYVVQMLFHPFHRGRFGVFSCSYITLIYIAINYVWTRNMWGPISPRS